MPKIASTKPTSTAARETQSAWVRLKSLWDDTFNMNSPTCSIRGSAEKMRVSIGCKPFLLFRSSTDVAVLKLIDLCVVDWASLLVSVGCSPRSMGSHPTSLITDPPRGEFTIVMSSTIISSRVASLSLYLIKRNAPKNERTATYERCT